MGTSQLDLKQHYEQAAKVYERAHFYDKSTKYHEWALNTISDSLGLGSAVAESPSAATDPVHEGSSPLAPSVQRPRLVDLGAGTGAFSAALGSSPLAPSVQRLRLVDLGAGTGAFSAALAQAHSNLDVLAVEPFSAMLSVGQGKYAHLISTRCEDAATFAADGSMSYDKILLKEMAHHLKSEDRPAVFGGIMRQLTPGGVCVIVTRPQEVGYPFFEAARATWRANQPPVEEFTSCLESAGFVCVEVKEATYPVTMPLAQWLGMVSGRFWSTFSHFSDEQLEAGIAEVEQQWRTDDGLVSFKERLLIVTGRAP